MKDKKYYAPSVEEFRIGFEYEMASVDNNWRNTGWSKTMYNNNFTFKDITSYPGLFRVKYLDKEDIESLGFTDKKYGWYTMKAPGQLGHWTSIVLRKWHDNEIFIKGLRGVGLDILENEDDEQYLFDGNIKNKSELKTLLKQLKIL